MSLIRVNGGGTSIPPVIEKGKISYCTYPSGGSPTAYSGDADNYSNSNCNYFGYGIINAEDLTSLTVTVNHIRTGVIIGYTGGAATVITANIAGTAVDITNYDTVAFVLEYDGAFTVTVAAS